MPSDNNWRRLTGWNLAGYLGDIREHDRAGIGRERRLEAADLYQVVVFLRKNEHTLRVSQRNLLDLAARFLEEEVFLLNHPVPRFRTYANIRPLNRALGITRTSTLDDIRRRCWTAIDVLLRDMREHEMAALSGEPEKQRDGFDPTRSRKRVCLITRSLHRYVRVVRRPLFAPSAHLDTPPSSFAAFAADGTDVLNILHLTALPQSTHHDERFFLRTVHCGEAVFVGTLMHVAAAREAALAGNTPVAAEQIRCAVEFAQVLVPVFQIFDATMSAPQFLAFRQATGDSSAIQSRNYQLLTIHTRGLTAEKAEEISKTPELVDLMAYGDPAFMPLDAITETFIARNAPEDGEFILAAQELDKQLRAWVGIHFGVATRNLPAQEKGTGGTTGLEYLRRTYRHGMWQKHPLYRLGQDFLSIRPLMSEDN